MPANHKQQPSKKRAAKRKGAVLPKAASSTQPVGKQKPRTKAKPEIEPAKRIAGVGVPARTVVLDSNNVTLASLEVGNGGAAIRVSEKQAAGLHRLGDPAL
jgi:hypothetical protein